MIRCTIKGHLKPVIVSASRFVVKLDNSVAGVADRNFSRLTLLCWLGVLTVVGRSLNFKMYELSEQCVSDV